MTLVFFCIYLPKTLAGRSILSSEPFGIRKDVHSGSMSG